MRRNVSRSGAARKHRQQRFQIKTWVDKLPDVPCFILGNGPSILDHDLSALDDYFTIGLNRIFKLFDPTILLWQDISLWKTEYHYIHNLQAMKVARDVADPRRVYYNFHLKGGGYKFDPTKAHILYGRGSSGPIATQLAVALGCRPIILLGMDCKRDSEGRGDFYGENSPWLSHTLENCELGLQFIKKHCPVQVINASASDLWQKRQLKDVLRDDIDPSYAWGRQKLTSILRSFP